MIKYGALLIGVLLFWHSAAQIRLSGTVYSASDSMPVPDAYVVVKNLKTGRLRGNTLTDKEGRFVLNIPKDTLLFIKIHHPLFIPAQKSLIWAADRDSIFLPVYLKPRGEQLSEVVIDVQKPVIVKQDTVIYNIQTMLSTRDETLEEVLKKFGDFEILPNGEIKVRGQRVDKVLVNGKEVSNVGPAVITKSIDPEKVEKVEVRFKDKEQRFKESLLDRKDLVILDIKLKEDLKHPFFGRLKTHLTSKDKIIPGGYGNIFYLRPRFKWHSFAEHDVTGRQTISMRQLSRMGDDRWAEMFRVSGDFDLMKNKEGYKEEIFGMDDYLRWERSIAGFTAKYNAGPHWEFFAGMFVSRDRKWQKNSMELVFPTDVYRISQWQNQEILQSKNKWYARYNTDNTRFYTDIWFQAARTQDDFAENNTADSLHFSSATDDMPVKWMGRMAYEHLWNEQWGLRLALVASRNRLNQNFHLIDLPDQVASVLSDTSGKPVYRFNQQNFMRNTGLRPEITWQYHSSGLTAEIQYRFNRIVYDYRQYGFNDATQTPVAPFRLDTTVIYSENLLALSVQWMPGEAWEFYVKPSLIRPRIPGTNIGVSYLQWQSQVSYQPGMSFRISSRYSRQLRPYSFLRQFVLHSFRDFQELYIYSGEPFHRYFETVWSTDVTYTPGSFQFIGAYMHGQARGKDYARSFAWHITARIPSDLESHYDMVSLSFQQKIPGLHLQVKWEPEAIWVNRQNKYHNHLYLSHTRAWLMGLTARFHAFDNKLQMKWYLKYTHFRFDNELLGTLPAYKFWRNEMSISYLFPDQWNMQLSNHLFLIPQHHIPYHLLSLNIQKAWKNSKIYVRLYNILNKNLLLIQDQTPLFFESRYTSLQSRYVQVGYVWRF